MPQNRTSIQSSRPSLPSTQKKRKIKNPWREFKMTNIIWKAKDASSTVSAPKSQVRPYMDMIPIILMINRSVVLRSFCFLAPPRLVLYLCRISTTTTVMKMTELKRITARIGARKAAKKAAVLLMKQLWKITIHVVSQHSNKPKG